MESRFLPYGKVDTILNYYVLPLVGVNRGHFSTNFITTKLNVEGTIVFVMLKEDSYSDTLFKYKVYNEGKFYLYFYIPEQFLLDVKLIIEGKYSEISLKAKTLIRKNSGLIYKEKNSSGDIITSKLLFALDKSEVLVNYLFETLKSGNSDTDTELYQLLKTKELVDKLSDDDFL